jgi:asparagine synthase (glutamine-hydrolysing)
MYLDRYGFLAHNLMVTDKSSMASSIEVRVPLMSNALADLGFSLPDSDLIDRAAGKKPLHAFLNKRLPRELLNRPKVGFNPPLDDKIRALGEARITELLTSGPAADVLNMDVAKMLIRSHFDGRINQTYKLWQLLYFNFWVEAVSANARAATVA